MRKRSQHKQRWEKRSGEKHRPLSPSSTPPGTESAPYNELEDAFASFPDAIMLCDRQGKILHLNAAALTLFGISSEQVYQGIPYPQFLHSYTIRDERQQPVSPETWLAQMLLPEETCPPLPEHFLWLRASSGRKISFTLRNTPLLHAHQHLVGMVSVFHEVTSEDQDAFHLHRVQQAVATLTKALAQLPPQVDLSVPEETFLLSPPIAFIAQQVVEVIAHVLECYQLILVAFEPPSGYLYYVAGFGFTPEKEQQFRESRGHFLLSDIVNDTVIAHLQSGQEVIVPAEHLTLPSWYPPSFEGEHDLLVPLFLERQWVGLLGIAKDGSSHAYERDDMEIVQAVVTQAALVMECAHGLRCYAEARSRALMLDEAKRLSNDFLTLASHELRTPLTVIKGNLQLAQRRLQALNCLAAEQCERVAQIQHSLVAATRGVQIQERMVQDLLDDASIQANHLELSLKPCDLLALVKETVSVWQQSMPEQAILLEISRTRQTLPVLADADRIKRVLNRYIENALTASSLHQPVTVRIEVERAIARISVQHQGGGIPTEEQGQIWERSYRTKGSTIQHGVDLSLGLGLYLCRVFIERHHGSVGVQNIPGQGATFWFSLPLTLPSAS